VTTHATTHATTASVSMQSGTAAPSVERSTAVPSSRSSTVATHATTTTVSVQSAAAATDTPQRQSSNFPVGVVAGSIVGGVVLAILALLGWTYWGKSFRRRQRDEVRTILTTKDHTHARSSRRAPAHKKPLLIQSPEEKQQLERNISPDGANEKPDAYNRMRRVSAPDSVESMGQLSSPPQVVFKPAKISQPRTLRKNKRLKRLIDRKPPLSPIADVDNEAVDASLEEPSINLFADTNAFVVNAPTSISHKPSTIGSASVYSTESGEERQHIGNPSFILEALGPPGLDIPMARPRPAISHKPSNVSSIYSCQSGEERDFGVPSNFLATLDQERRRFTASTGSSRPLHSTAEELPSACVRPRAIKAEGRDATQLSRLSQVSSASAYSS